MDKSKPSTEILKSDERIKNFSLKLTGSYIAIRALFRLFSFNSGATSISINLLFTFVLQIFFDRRNINSLDFDEFIPLAGGFVTGCRKIYEMESDCGNNCYCN